MGEEDGTLRNDMWYSAIIWNSRSIAQTITMMLIGIGAYTLNAMIQCNQIDSGDLVIATYNSADLFPPQHCIQLDDVVTPTEYVFDELLGRSSGNINLAYNLYVVFAFIGQSMVWGAFWYSWYISDEEKHGKFIFGNDAHTQKVWITVYGVFYLLSVVFASWGLDTYNQCSGLHMGLGNGSLYECDKGGVNRDLYVTLLGISVGINVVLFIGEFIATLISINSVYDGIVGSKILQVARKSNQFRKFEQKRKLRNVGGSLDKNLIYN
jgi:hypothetical protein